MGEENIWQSCRSGVRGSDPATGDIATSDPAVGLGAELTLELHEAPDLGPVGPDIGLDVSGRLTDGVARSTPRSSAHRPSGAAIGRE